MSRWGKQRKDRREGNTGLGIRIKGEKKRLDFQVRKGISFEANVVRNMNFVGYWIPHPVRAMAFFIAKEDAFHSQG